MALLQTLVFHTRAIYHARQQILRSREIREGADILRAFFRRRDRGWTMSESCVHKVAMICSNRHQLCQSTGDEILWDLGIL